MALKKSDIFADDLFRDVNAEAEIFLNLSKDILKILEKELQVSQKFLETWKAAGATSINEMNAAVKNSNTVMQKYVNLEVEAEKVKQQQIKTQKAQIGLQSQVQRALKAEVREKEKLNSLYKTESARLNELRNKFKDLALAEGVATAETIKLEKEISDLDARLKSVDARAGQFQRNVGNYASGIGNLKGQLRSFGAGFAGQLGIVGGASAAGAAIVNFAKDSVRAFQDFDAAARDLQAITGINEEQLKRFEAQAKKVGSTTRTSATEYLNAVKLIGSAAPQYLEDEVALNRLTKASIVLSDATKEDLATSAAATTAVMNQFNLTINDTERIINGLAAGSLKGSAEVPELTESFKNVGTVAANANITFEGTVALLETLAAKQLKGAEAGTKLRGAISQLQKAGVGFASGQFNINDALAEAEQKLNAIADPAKRAQAAIKLFGVENQVAGQILIEGQDQLKRLTKEITGTATAYEQQATQNKSAAAQQQIHNNRIETLSITIGEKLQPVVDALRQGLILLGEAVVKVADAFREANPTLVAASQELERLNKEQIKLQKTADAYNKIKKELPEVHKEFVKLNKSGQDQNRTVVKLANALEIISRGDKGIQESFKKRNSLYESGRHTITEYTNSILLLAQAQLKIEKEAKKKQEEDGDEAGTGVATQEQLDKEYDRLLKQLERERDLRDLNSEQTIKDNDLLNEALIDSQVTYLTKRAELEKRFGKEHEKTQLELVRFEKKNDEDRVKQVKERLAKQKDILDKQDELEISLIGTARDREKAERQFRFEQEIYDLEQQGKLTYEIEINLKKKLVQDLKAIDDKFDKEESDDLKARQDRLQKLIDEGDEFIRQAEEERLRQRKEFAEKTIGIIEDELRREGELREQSINNNIDRIEREISRQEELAALGRDNILAQKEAELAQQQLRLEEEKKKQLRQERAIAFARLVAGYADKEPEQAVRKAFLDLALMTAIQGFFADGVEGFRGKGTTTSDSNIVAISDQESIVTAKGTIQNEGLVTAMNKSKSAVLDWFLNSSYLPRAMVASAVPKNSGELMMGAATIQQLGTLINRMDKIEQTIKKRPVNQTEFKGFTEEISKTIVDGFTHVKKTIHDKPKF